MHNRTQALELGAKYYETGEPCKKGHVAKRRVSNYRCTECIKENTKRKKEAAKQAEAGRARPHCCEICGARKRIVFDHEHKSGRFRGWICDRCNKVLGLCYDDSTLLRKLGSYLDGWNHGQAHIEETKRAAVKSVRPPWFPEISGTRPQPRCER